MSEIPKDNFIKKAAITGAGFALGATLITAAAGQNAQRADNARLAEELHAEKAQKSAEYVLSAQEVAKGMFSIEDVVDSFTVEQGGGLETSALRVIEDSLGTDIYNQAKPLFYDALMASIELHGIPQPGQEKAVVITDIDPEADNGSEYLVVNATQINHGSADELPSPDTH